MSRRWWPWLPVFSGTIATLALSSAPSVAHAYLLLSKGSKTAAVGTSVVVLREGEHDVVSLRFRIKDKGDRVVVVVPVPASVMEQQAGPSAPFAALASVVSPRVEELWEQDPCELHGMGGPPLGPSAQPDAPRPKKKPKSGPKSAPEGDYEISVLEGKGAEVVAALKAKGLTLSDEVEPLIVAYADVGMKLVVAEIATADLEGNELPPLLIHAKAKELTLPTRLHAAGKAGPLDVFVLSPNMRFEAKNQKNQAIPTNLDVKVPAAKNPAGFYSALVARTFSDAPDAIVTEYAWRALDCDSCAAPLDASVISRLGIGLLPSAAGGQQEVIVDAEGVSGEPGGPEGLRKALATCYEKAIAATPGLGGSVTLDVVVKDEKVDSAKSRTTAPEALVSCATGAAKAADLDESGALTVTFSPMSRKFLADLVLTKLRVQQAAVPEKDLRLGAARAIAGGRETGPEGKPEKKVYWAEATNNFQPRYVVRHAWKGAVKCLTPERGSWGGPPKGESTKPGGKPGGAIPALETLIEGGLPDVSAYAIASSKAIAPAAPDSPTDTPATEASATPSPSSNAAPPPATDAGCGCSLSAPPADRAPWLSGLFALAWLRAKRKRAQRDGR